MPPELLTLVGNMGLPAILIVWGVWFFQTQAWPKFTSHLDKVGELVDSVKLVAITNAKTEDRITSIDEGVQELLIRIPQRHERESA